MHGRPSAGCPGWHWLSAVLLCFPQLLQAGVQSHVASLQDAQWEVEASPLNCVLSHPVPGYGEARFSSRAGVELDFTLEATRPLAREGLARLFSQAPPWRHDVLFLELGDVPMLAGNQPVRLTADLALRLLAELEKGMMVVFAYRDRVDGRDEIRVLLSAVNLSPALREFRQCQSGLASYSFDDVAKNLLWFAPGRADLDEQGRQVLQRIAGYLQLDADIQTVRIEGYTDSQGTRRANLRMAQKRVEAVRDYLLAQGASADKLILQSYGPARPVASNATPEGRAQNRRVEITLVR